jgi:hypothetical protein
MRHTAAFVTYMLIKRLGPRISIVSNNYTQNRRNCYIKNVCRFLTEHVHGPSGMLLAVKIVQLHKILISGDLEVGHPRCVCYEAIKETYIMLISHNNYL